MPRPKFEGVLLSKNHRTNTSLVLQTVIMILHMKRTLNIRHFCLPNNLLQDINGMWQNITLNKCQVGKIILSISFQKQGVPLFERVPQFK